MKNMIFIFLILILFPVTMTADLISRPGDVNGDLVIDIVDALLIAQRYVGLPVDNFDPAAADVDCSGDSDIVDALLVAQYYVGLISEFPCIRPEIPDIVVFDPLDKQMNTDADPSYVFYQNGVVDAMFSIKNRGNGVLELTGDPPVSVIVDESSGNNLSIIEQPPAVIDIGESVSFIVRYSPDSGIFNPQSARISIESNDPDQPVMEFSILSNNIGTYNDYFNANPDVKDLTMNSYIPLAQKYVFEYLAELESNGQIDIDVPEALQDAETTGATTAILTSDEHWAILGAKAAHALWLDKNEILPWTLAEYTKDELSGLFTNSELFDSGSSFYSVVDFSPPEVYGYMLEHDLIGTTILDTMYRVFYDLRTTNDKLSFIHGSSSVGDPDTIYSLYYALTTWKDRGDAGDVKISRRGCHSMTRIMVGMLRSVNIPGTITSNGTWFESGHSSAYWSHVRLVLSHGDDVYTGTLQKTPTEEMLIPVSVYSDPAYIEVCGNDPYLIARRYKALRAFTYPDKWITTHCCNPETYGYIDCFDYINQNYSQVLTPGEIENAVNMMLNDYCGS